MKNLNRWGLATGLAAALTLFGTAQAESTGSSAAPPAGGSGDTGASGRESATERQQTGSSAVSGGREGASSDTAGSTGTSSTDTATGGSASASRAGSTERKVDKGLQEKLEKLHAANQAEIHMAKVGQQNAQSPEVKSYAEKLETDHQKLDDKLTETAQSAGVALEGKSYQKEVDSSMKTMGKLQKKTGADFDKAYMSQMVKDHKKDIKEVESAAKDAHKANQTELASLLDQAKTGMQGHLSEAQQIEKSLKSQPRQRAAGERPSSMGTGSSGAAEQGSGSSGATGSGPTGASKHGAGGPATSPGGSTANPSLPSSGSEKSK